MWKLEDGKLPVRAEQGVNGGLRELVISGQVGLRGAPWDVEAVLKEVEGVKNAGDGRECARAALLLLAGRWEEAHRVCQDVPTAYGAAWHGVAHRLEGDFWNSKYWWKRAGGVKWDRLAEERAAIVRGVPAEVAGELRGMVERWDPARFVDLVERYGEREAWREVLVELQRWEWAALFAETWERG